MEQSLLFRSRWDRIQSEIWRNHLHKGLFFFYLNFFNVKL